MVIVRKSRLLLFALCMMAPVLCGLILYYVVYRAGQVQKGAIDRLKQDCAAVEVYYESDVDLRGGDFERLGYEIQRMMGHQRVAGLRLELLPGTKRLPANMLAPFKRLQRLTLDCAGTDVDLSMLGTVPDLWSITFEGELLADLSKLESCRSLLLLDTRRTEKAEFEASSIAELGRNGIKVVWWLMGYSLHPSDCYLRGGGKGPQHFYDHIVAAAPECRIVLHTAGD